METVKDLTELLVPQLDTDKDRADTPERAGHDLSYIDYITRQQLNADKIRTLPNKQ